VAARRKADVLIRERRVRVNGAAPPPGGCLVRPGTDRVTVDGVVIEPGTQGHAYYAVNKPAGYLSAESDRSRRPLVSSLVKDAISRVHPVGRLDLDSRGLMILTDDGELSYRLQHPRFHVEREYEAVIEGELGRVDRRRLLDGIDLEDGRSRLAEVEVIASFAPSRRTKLRVVMKQGRNRQLRRTLAAIGHRVIDLRRVRIGSLRIGRLKEGGFRKLTVAEIAALRESVGL